MGAPRISTLFLPFLFIHFVSLGSHLSFAIDFISSNRPLSKDQAITSKGNKFVLGVSSYSVDIWHTNVGAGSPVWTLNSERPSYDADTLELRISDDGNLVLLDKSTQEQFWSTDLESTASNSTVAVILDSGNLVLRDGSDPNKIFWQSCDHPTDTWLPGCYLGLNKVTGENRRLTSRDESSPGVFSLEVDSGQLLIKLSESKKYLSCGNLTDGLVFSSAPNFSRFAVYEYISNETVNYITYSLRYNQTFVVFRLDGSRVMEQILLADDGNDVGLSRYPDPPNQCGNPAFCGPFGICSKEDLNRCSCPNGFHVASSGDRNSGRRSNGCARNVPLQCGANDMFSEVCRVRGFGTFNYLVTDNADTCKLACLSNCSCTAYLFHDWCYLWSGNLFNLQTSDYFDDFSYCIYLRVGSTEMKKSNNMSRVVTFVIP